MIKNLILPLVLIIFLSLADSVLAGGAITLPNPLCPAKKNPCEPSPTCVCGFADLIERIIKFVLDIIGAIAVIVFIWAGILFLTSAGNEAQLGKARKALIYAVIGIAIALAGNGLIEAIKAIIISPPK